MAFYDALWDKAAAPVTILHEWELQMQFECWKKRLSTVKATKAPAMKAKGVEKFGKAMKTMKAKGANAMCQPKPVMMPKSRAMKVKNVAPQGKTTPTRTKDTARPGRNRARVTRATSRACQRQTVPDVTAKNTKPRLRGAC